MLPACRKQTGPWCRDSLGGQGVWSTRWFLGSQGGGGKGAPRFVWSVSPPAASTGSRGVPGIVWVSDSLETGSGAFSATSWIHKHLKSPEPPRWFWSDCARLADGEHGSGDPALRAAGLCCGPARVTACPPGPPPPCSCGTSGGAVCSSGSPSWTATSKSSCT